MKLPTLPARLKKLALLAATVLGCASMAHLPPGLAPIAIAQTPAAQPAAPAAAGPFSAEQKAAIEKIVKEYFLNNPEAFLEIQTALESKMEKIQADKFKAVLQESSKEIYRRAESPVAGNPNGDITVVEFFDYNCGYCKRAFSDMAKLVEKDSKVRLVLKELPILSKGSEEGARVALAAKLQGKYWEAHRALLALRGEINEQTALKAVEKIGLDMAKLKKDLDAPEVKAEIAMVRGLAQRLGVQGTPHFLVGDRAIPGAPQNLLEQVSGHIAELRKSGCSFC
jgi:protein-disulfide isomerase